MLKRLRSMARQSKNIKFLDQIYYAMGNIYLAAEDTLKAIESYEKGVTKGTRNGVEKGVLYLKLGDLYYSRNDFTSCKRCYSKAVSMIDKEREDYEDIEKKSKIIEELEPHTAAVHLQDSLQLLANMDEDRRNAIIDKMQHFLLELGKGFAFIGRQYHITINNRHYHIDLVFYHRILKCFVLIDLKKNAVRHQDIGQMNMYLGYFAKEESAPDDNPPVGIILSHIKDELLVEYATYGMDSKLFVSKYELYLPNKEELRRLVDGVVSDELNKNNKK